MCEFESNQVKIFLFEEEEEGGVICVCMWLTYGMMYVESELRTGR